MDVFRYELRKTLILNGGMITACAFILLFFALNVYLDMPHNYSLEREKERYFVNGKPHTWSKKSAALAGGEC